MSTCAETETVESNRAVKMEEGDGLLHLKEGIVAYRLLDCRT